MQNGMVTKWLVASLLLVVVVQSIWTFTPDPKPELSQIMNRYPIGTQGSVYEVLSNSGGATVPMVYLYFIAARQSDNAVDGVPAVHGVAWGDAGGDGVAVAAAGWVVWMRLGALE